MIPAFFRSRPSLRVLSVLAVGLALAGVVSAVFGGIFDVGAVRLYAGAPTVLIGALWAYVLRIPKTIGRSPIRWGWVASVPLAMANAALAAAMMLGFEGGPVGALAGLVFGATVGAIFWVPAMLATLLCFGVPIAWAQRLAKRGLAGEERGDVIVGAACLTLATLALFVGPLRHVHHDGAWIWVTRALAALGVLAGGAVAGLALDRQARRRAFVREVEAGTVPGFRVDPTAEGKVLLRVSPLGEGYRVADYEQELFELDAQGEATRPRRALRADVP